MTVLERGAATSPSARRGETIETAGPLPPPDAASTPRPVEGYYRLHAKIYDATRWSFLFGRAALLDRLPRGFAPQRVLEIGCGTGAVLARIARRFPQAEAVGLDCSQDMLSIARRRLGPFGDRVRVEHRAYGESPATAPSFDLVVASYALSMFNPGWEAAIDAAHADLRLGGLIAIVDFHDSRFAWFRRWMGVNHVRLDGHLLPRLSQRFEPVHVATPRAYGGVWRFATFIGRRR